MKFAVTIQGISGLLQCRHPSPEEEKGITGINGDSGVRKRQPTDDEMFDLHAFRTPDGKFYQQPVQVIGSIIEAAKNFRIPNEGKKTYARILMGGVLIEEDYLMHKNQKIDRKIKTQDLPNKQAKGWYVDNRWGVNKNTGGAVWVVRPRIDNWELNFTLNLLQDERVPVDLFRQILEYAGLYVGIGSYRAPKGGNFGRYKIIKFQPVEK